MRSGRCLGGNRTRDRALGSLPGKQTDLGDFGADAGVVDPPLVRVPAAGADADEVGTSTLRMCVMRLWRGIAPSVDVEGLPAAWDVAEVPPT